jgi:cobalt/nickel transport system permease protein
MHVHWIDQYRSGNSLIHRLDARVKLTLAIAYILVASLTPVGAWFAYGMLFTFAVVATLASGLGFLLVQRRALVAIPFALAAITIVFTTDGPVAFTQSLGPWRLQATEPGLVRFASILVKSWLSVQIAIILAGTTPFPDLIAAMRSLRFPRALVAIISFMWRYVFVLVDEAVRLRRARDARSAVRSGIKGGGKVTWRAKVVGGMAGNLFLRSYSRSERIYQAMAARGYQGELRTLTLPHPHRIDWSVGVAVVGYLAIVLVVGIVLR